MIDVKITMVGELATNCYIITDTHTGEKAIIDPGATSPSVRGIIKNSPDKIQYVLRTHGHFDHIGYVSTLKKETNAKIAISRQDSDCLSKPERNLSHKFFGRKPEAVEPDILLEEGDTLKLGNSEIKFILTPGHSSGSGCYIVDNQIFTGDTIFRLSIGRTDLPTGSYREIVKSLKRIASLEGEYYIYPGHGEATMLSYEKNFNPYLKQVI